MKNYLPLWYEEVEGLEGNLDKEEQEILSQLNPQPELLPIRWDLQSVFRLIEDNRPQLWRWLSLYPGQFDDLSGEELDVLNKMPTRFLVDSPLNFSARSIKMLVRAKIEEAKKEKEEERAAAIRRSLEIDKDKWDLCRQLQRKASSQTLAPTFLFSIVCSSAFIISSLPVAIAVTLVCFLVQLILTQRAGRYIKQANAVRESITSMPPVKDAPPAKDRVGVMALLLPVFAGAILGAGISGLFTGNTVPAGWIAGIAGVLLILSIRGLVTD